MHHQRTGRIGGHGHPLTGHFGQCARGGHAGDTDRFGGCGRAADEFRHQKWWMRHHNRPNDHGIGGYLAIGVPIRALTCLNARGITPHKCVASDRAGLTVGEASGERHCDPDI